MTPEWLGPALNTGALATIVAFVLWGIVKICRFLAPKVTAVAEGHVAVMNTLGEASIRQTSLLERQTGMLNDHGQTLNIHGQILNIHTEQLRHIADSVGAKIARQRDGSITLQQGIEVSSSGATTPVVVAQEVIRPTEQKPS